MSKGVFGVVTCELFQFLGIVNPSYASCAVCCGSPGSLSASMSSWTVVFWFTVMFCSRMWVYSSRVSVTSITSVMVPGGPLFCIFHCRIVFGRICFVRGYSCALMLCMGCVDVVVIEAVILDA